MDLRNSKVKSIFDSARELPEEMRAAYIAAACGDDPSGREMAAQVTMLLADLASADSFFDMSAAGGAAALATRLVADTEENGEGVGSLVGPYKLLERIGEGGFGLVYMAQQERPIRRRVAIKIIKLGLETKQVIARFEQERQALAMMDHPNIARVLDAGTTSAGRPYFAMELVRGEPITTFCDKKRLSVSERLKLFTKVCRAVQHAHQKGIIHRDLKPSNVLVTVGDGDTPIPKVIDFGIAKATEARLTERTLFTEFRQMIGTPEYMSPEQAGMGAAGGLDIDTRSDVYSLGALLYQLLTGAAPFDPARLRSASFGELQRIIKEEDPPRPSTRVSTQPAIPKTTDSRQLHPARLDVPARRELDWIVMRCLEKDRNRRYASAGDLARDILCYLSNEPLEAGPPTAAYRFRKFVRRNKGPVVLSAAVGGMLIVGTVGTSIGLVWAVRERADAEAARLQEVFHRDEALRQAALAERESARAALAATITAFEASDGGAASRNIELVPASQQGWAWKHLRSRISESGVIIRPAATGATPPRFIHADALGPDRLFALCSDDQIRTYDIESGLPGLTVPGLSAASSPDGETMLIVQLDGSLGHFNSRTGERLWQLEPLDGATRYRIGRQAFFADGTTVAVTVEKKPWILLIEVAQGRVLRRLDVGMETPVPWALVDPRGSTVLLALSRDRRVLLDPETGDVRTMPQLFQGPSHSSRRYVGASGPNHVGFHEVLGETIVNVLPSRGVSYRDADLSDDASRLATVDSAGNIRLWRVSRGSQSAAPIGAWFVGDSSLYEDVFFMRGGQKIVAVRPQIINILDAAGGAQMYSLVSDFRSGPSAFSPDGSRLFIGGWAEVTAVDAEDGRFLWRTSLDFNSVRGAAVSPDNALVAVATMDDGFRRCGLWVLRASDGAVVHARAHESFTVGVEPDEPPPLISSLTFSADGSSLIVGYATGQISSYSIRDWTLQETRVLPMVPLIIRADPHSGLIAVGGASNTERSARTHAFLYDPDWSGELHVLDRRLGEVHALQESSPVAALAWRTSASGGPSLVFSTRSGAVTSMRMPGGEVRWTSSMGLAGAISCLERSPDDSLVVLGSDSNGLALLEGATGELFIMMSVEGTGVFALSFTEDGSTLRMSAGSRPLGWLVTEPPAPDLLARRILNARATELAVASVYRGLDDLRVSASARRRYIQTRLSVSESIRAEALRLVDADRQRPVINNEALVYMANVLPHASPSDFEQAVECGLDAVRAAPHMQRHWHNLGRALFLAERYAESVDAYRHAVEMQVNEAGEPEVLTLVRLALAQFWAGTVEEARATLARAERLIETRRTSAVIRQQFAEVREVIGP